MKSLLGKMVMFIPSGLNTGNSDKILHTTTNGNNLIECPFGHHNSAQKINSVSFIPALVVQDWGGAVNLKVFIDGVQDGWVTSVTPFCGQGTMWDDQLHLLKEAGRCYLTIDEFEYYCENFEKRNW